MEDRKRGVDFSSKRLQAQRNLERRIQTILFQGAKRIVGISDRYRVGNRFMNERGFISEASRIITEAEADIASYMRAYSLASCKQLGIDNADVSAFLSGRVFGKSFSERNGTYLSNFAEDIVRMVKAGVLMGYPQSKILSAVRTGYKNPYQTSIITKARRKDFSIATPSYGKGKFHAAYANIVRNAVQMVSLAWGMAEQQYGRESGAIGFRVFRGSSYPCAVCDDECAYLHHFGDPYPPFHVSCVCFTVFVYASDVH